jgi:carbohydrate kinase (thermoresistant glucokinase family)
MQIGVVGLGRGVPLTDADRPPWLDAVAQWIDDRLGRGAPGIVCCSTLKRAYRQRVIGTRPLVGLVYLRGEIGLIMACLGRRADHFMPAALLASQFEALEEPPPDKRPAIASIEERPAGIAAAIIAQHGCTAAEGA